MLITLDPTYEPFTRARATAERQWAAPLRTLKGVRLGLLANGKEQGEALLEYILEELQEMEGVEVAEVVRAKKGDVTTPPRPEVFEKLVTDTDLIITGIGN